MSGHPAARVNDPSGHDATSFSGSVAFPVGPCGKAEVLIDGLSAAHVYCAVLCSGAARKGTVHPRMPVAPILVNGAASVLVHGVPIARAAGSGDFADCGAFVRLPGSPTVLIGGPGEDPSGAKCLARTVLKTGGHGTVSDCEFVADELARLPVYVIERVRQHGIKVVVCRGDVTDYLHDLEGVEPRNWPGQTWADATGAGGEDERTIAVVGHDTPTGAHVPEAGEGHGSQNVVIHELFHCIDDNEGEPSSSDHSFWEARANDYGRLSEYERQAGEGGPQETYAESAARYFGEDDEDARRRPHMHSYWESDPLHTK